MTIIRCLCLALFLLALGCGTLELPKAEQSTVTPHSHPTWWGGDPTCSPGCPAGQPGRW
jgi:hypothetical protein